MLRVSGWTLPAPRHHLLTIIHIYIHAFKTKMSISNSSTWNIILKIIKQWFNRYNFQRNCFLLWMLQIREEKRERGSRVGSNSKSGRLPLIPWNLACVHKWHFSRYLLLKSSSHKCISYYNSRWLTVYYLSKIQSQGAHLSVQHWLVNDMFNFYN